MFFEKKWEYTTFKITVNGIADNNFDIEYELNQKGKQGFELVSVIHEQFNKIFYLKRRCWLKISKHWYKIVGKNLQNIDTKHWYKINYI